jgi:hypothetical protein
MPDITPLPNDISSDTTTVAASITDNIYEPNSTPNSYEVANGRLDKTNLDATSLPLPKDVIRRGTFIKGSTSGANANTDYFDDLYQGAWDATVDAELADRMLPISGTGHTFYVPWADCKGVYFSWHISAVVSGMSVLLNSAPDNGVFWDFSDIAASGATGGRVAADGTSLLATTVVGPGAVKSYWTTIQGDTGLMLFVDGTPTWATLRTLPDGMNSMCAPYDSGSGDGAFSQQFFPDARHWSGHFVIDFINRNDAETSGTLLDSAINKGWHTVELRVAHTAKGVRFKTRRMTAIPFR